MEQAEEIPSRLLSQKLYAQLEAAIMDRDFAPGAHLVESKLSERYQVSRTPIREALSMLQRAGWVEIRPYAGAFVREVPIQETREVFALRASLEGLAARLASARVEPQGMQSLERIFEQGQKAVRDTHHEKLGRLNFEFHMGIASVARNRTLERMLVDLSRKVRWHFSAIASKRAPESWREHKAILAAIKEGNEARAEELVRRHSRASGDAFLRETFHDSIL